MPQSFQNWLEEKKGLSKSTLSEIDISYEEIEETNLIIDGKEFPMLEKLISRSGKNKFEKVTLRNLPQLTELKLWNCQIKKINISKCPSLVRLDVRNNLLIDLHFLSGLKGQLTHLDVSNNNLKSWLPFLGDFKNLESLFIGNRINNNIVSVLQNDCLQGSLEELKELNRLGKVDISNTDIDSGLKHLPTRAEKLGCSCYYFWRRKCFTIKEQLKKYPLNDDKLNGEWYNVDAWRRSHFGEAMTIANQMTEIELTSKRERNQPFINQQSQRENKVIKETRQMTNNVIINVNAPITSGGNITIADTFGDNANFSQQTITYQQELKETKIESLTIAKEEEIAIGQVGNINGGNVGVNTCHNYYDNKLIKTPKNQKKRTWSRRESYEEIQAEKPELMEIVEQEYQQSQQTSYPPKHEN